ncbi:MULTISPECIES: hypothetical protein [unclassified Anabaena]|uniref:hypothetical protein n=1 Tax=unclassified Anabaena TaxID=2619674 RepID=UPI000AFD0773|nr:MULTISPECIES: hypothetical protein [unclassified Anabaena]
MNEADTSNYRAVMESFNSADNSLQPQQTICPFYTVVPAANTTVANVPLLKPAANEQEHTQVADFKQDKTTQKDWVVELESETQTQVNDEFQKLLALNEELRTANNELYQQVEHLKDDLAETDKSLQWHKKRYSVTESMLNQQTQELSAAQEQIQSLFQQLETATTTVQRQEILIESYKAQLQISQQRIAQLERECALLQTNYNEQSQQIVQSENVCRELRTRLMRQQRQTLQFKAALEKCLDTSIPSDDSKAKSAHSTENTANFKSRFTKKARSLFPNAQPIKPWSAEPESPQPEPPPENPPVWSEPPAPTPFSSHYSTPNPPSDSLWNWPAQEEAPTPAQPPESQATIDDDAQTTPEEVSAVSSSSDLDQQIDSLIQMFFASQSESVASQASTPQPNLNQNPVVQPLFNSWASDGEVDEIPNTPSEQPLEPSPEVNPATPSTLSFNVFPSQQTVAAPNNPVEEVAPLTDLPPNSLDQDKYAEDSTSPSPVIYPQHQRKKRQSLASVELPNFNKPNGQ